jgi:hypothetical protein
LFQEPLGDPAHFLDKRLLIVDVLLDDLPRLVGARRLERTTEALLAPLQKIAADLDYSLCLLKDTREVRELPVLPPIDPIVIAGPPNGISDTRAFHTRRPRSEAGQPGILTADLRSVVNHRPSHKSSRTPLKNGWRTFPSADLARYSISASSFGSTQMPLWAIRFEYGCVFLISGFSRFCRSAAVTLSNPVIDLAGVEQVGSLAPR